MGEQQQQVDIGVLRRSLGLSLGEIATATDVSRTSVFRWERGGAIPPEALRTIRRLEQTRRRESPQADVLRAVSRGGRTVAELDGELKPKGRAALRAMLDSGTLVLRSVDKMDARGRCYRREAVFRASAPASDRTLPFDGPTLAAARRRSGLRAEDVASRLAVAPPTFRAWEAGSPPAARLDQLSRVFPAPAPTEIRSARRAAGWSHEDLAKRVGVTWTVVSTWEVPRRPETGPRPVPKARLVPLLAALQEAERAARVREEADVARIVGWVEAAPGISTSEVRHRLRSKEKGSARFRARAARLLTRAISSGAIVERMAGEPHSSAPGRLCRRLYPAGQAPRGAPSLSGHELYRLCERQGWTQAQLGHELGVSQTAVSQWQRRGDAQVPAQWRSRINELAHGAKRDSQTDMVRKVLAVLREKPGICEGQLLDAIGRSNRARRALRDLLSEGAVVRAPSWDRLGRPFPGFYAAGEEVEERRRLRGSDLRRRRHQAGLSAGQLGRMLGVAGNTITRWETGVRACPPKRQEELLNALNVTANLTANGAADR